jgi:hypothetical protein
MKILDRSPLPYVPSFRMKPNHLRQRMSIYRKRVEEERKAQENQRQQRPEEWT